MTKSLNLRSILLEGITICDSYEELAIKRQIERNVAKLEASAVKVYGSVDANGNILDAFGPQSEYDTHSALLIAIEPIQKTVSKSEIVHLLRTNDNLTSKKLADMADRIEQFGIDGWR